MKVFIIINIENISVTPQKIVIILLQSFLSPSLAQAITDLFFVIIGSTLHTLCILSLVSSVQHYDFEIYLL